MKKIGVLLLAMTLAACADSGDKPVAPKDEVSAKPAKQQSKTENLICPQTAILEQAEKMFDYGGETPDPSQLVAEARMTAVKGDCAYRKDGIDIAFTLHMQAARGKKLSGRT